MTANEFAKWLLLMRYAELAKSDRDCARLLDVQPNTVIRWKRDGADKLVALACNALLLGVPPFSIAPGERTSPEPQQ